MHTSVHCIFCHTFLPRLCIQLLGVPLVDSYGMTETSGGVFSTSILGDTAPPGSVGKPITPMLHVKVQHARLPVAAACRQNCPASALREQADMPLAVHRRSWMIGAARSLPSRRARCASGGWQMCTV